MHRFIIIKFLQFYSGEQQKYTVFQHSALTRLKRRRIISSFKINGLALMRRFSLFLAAIFFIFYSVIVQADLAGKPVKVNLIVFTHVNKQSLASESWPQQLINPSYTNTLQLLPSDAILTDDNGIQGYATQFKLLPRHKVGLAWTVHRLRDEGNTIVLDIAWVMPAIETNHWLHIYGGQAYDSTGQPLQLDSSIYSIPSIEQSQSVVYWELNGLLRISYDRLFTVETKLYLTLPKQLGDFDASQFGLVPLNTYTLMGKRDLRAGQMAYFDHPLFGVLVMVTPVKS